VNTLQSINDFFLEKRIILAGVSRQPTDFSRRLMRDMVLRGYEIIPTNPASEAIDGVRCFSRITAVNPVPTAAMLMTRAETLPELAQDCAIAGIRKVWVLRSAGDRVARLRAIKILEENLIEVVDGICPYLYLSESGMPHSLHRGIAQLFGMMPH